jgi:polyisoprenoid-binding protein YceI
MKAKAATFLAVVLASAWAARASAATVHAIDPAHSTVTVYVYKEGLFAFAADDHEIAAPIASGSVDEAAGSVDVTVDATKMLVLDPKLGDARRAQVQSNMTGPQVLDVKTYPTIVFKARAMRLPATGHMTFAGDLTLHGQTHQVTVDLTRVDATHFTGAAVVRQSSFGITPIRIAGGMVRVKDDVKVVFAIALR